MISDMIKEAKRLNLDKLNDPFDPKDLKWRIQSCGMAKCGKEEKPWALCLAYVTARAIHRRLDEVVGKANWQLKYEEHRIGSGHGTVCLIGIRVDGEWIWKSGGADETDFEAYKGGLSSADKRAGVPWGLTAYLYDLQNNFAITTLKKPPKGDNSWIKQKATKDMPLFWWKPPELPEWALPQPERYKVRGFPTNPVPHIVGDNPTEKRSLNESDSQQPSAVLEGRSALAQPTVGQDEIGQEGMYSMEEIKKMLGTYAFTDLHRERAEGTFALSTPDAGKKIGALGVKVAEKYDISQKWVTERVVEKLANDKSLLGPKAKEDAIKEFKVGYAHLTLDNLKALVEREQKLKKESKK